MPGLVIRRAVVDDAALLAEHRALVWYEYGEPPDAVAAQIPVWAAWMRTAVDDETYVAFIAEASGTPIASASLLVHTALPRPGYAGARDGRIHSVWVEPDARRRGIARVLMERVLAHARAIALMRVTLHPTDMSRTLYETLGFERLDEMGLYLGK